MDASVKLVEYNPEWPTVFEQEKARILGELSSEFVVVEHIGSTSIPGLLNILITVCRHKGKGNY